MPNVLTTDTIFREITVTHPRGYNRAEFEETLRKRLDAIFPGAAERAPVARVGTAAELKTALDSSNGFQEQD